MQLFNNIPSLNPFSRLPLLTGAFWVMACCFTTSAQAQISPVVWDKSFGGPQLDGAGDFSRQRLIPNAGNTGFFFGGASNSQAGGTKSEPTRGDADYWALNIRNDGAVVWEKTFGGSGREGNPKIVRHSSGNLFWIGTSNSSISGDKSLSNKPGSLTQHYDIWILKSDASGNKIDEYVIGGDILDVAWDCIETSDGNLVLLGQTTSPASFDVSDATFGGRDLWVIKLTPNGTILWDKRLGGNRDDGGYEIKEGPNGNLFIAGSTNSDISGSVSQTGRGDHDFWVVNLRSDGALIWERRFGTDLFDQATSLTLLHDGPVVAGNSAGGQNGEKRLPNRGSLDFWVIHLDWNGQLIWEKSIGGSDFDELQNVMINCAGQILVGGTSMSPVGFEKSTPSKGQLDMWLVKLDALGNILWDLTLGGSGLDQVSSQLDHPEGGIMICGLSNSPVSGDKSDAGFGEMDFWVSRIRVKSEFAAPDTICLDDAPQFLNNSTLISDEFEWDFGDPLSGAQNTSHEFEPVHYFSEPGTYQVRLTAREGCDSDVFVRTIVVLPLPKPDFSWPEQFFQANEPVSFVNLTPGMPNFLWSWGDGTTSTQFTPTHSYDSDGSYTIVLYAEDPQTGCHATTAQQIEIQSEFQLFFPDAFTPNGDGLNDHFTVSTPLVTNIEFHVFDRTGNEIYTSIGPQIDWDGRLNGKSLPEGVYIYTYTAHHQSGKKSEGAGAITLFR